MRRCSCEYCAGASARVAGEVVALLPGKSGYIVRSGTGEYPTATCAGIPVGIGLPHLAVRLLERRRRASRRFGGPRSTTSDHVRGSICGSTSSARGPCGQGVNAADPRCAHAFYGARRASSIRAVTTPEPGHGVRISRRALRDAERNTRGSHELTGPNKRSRSGSISARTRSIVSAHQGPSPTAGCNARRDARTGRLHQGLSPRGRGGGGIEPAAALRAGDRQARRVARRASIRTASARGDALGRRCTIASIPPTKPVKRSSRCASPPRRGHAPPRPNVLSHRMDYTAGSGYGRDRS